MFFAFIMLYFISREVVNVVGKMYLSRDGSKIMISHLNFFGKRRDIEFNVEDIENLDSINEIYAPFFDLRLRNLEGSMKLSLKYSKTNNKKAILRIFKIKTEK
jgi:hypothetical protein